MMSKLIKIPFNAWSRRKLRERKKGGTSRTRRYGDPNDGFDVKLNGETRRYYINCVDHLPLSTVARVYYKVEGCKSPDEFKRVWVEIHPKKGFVGSQMVWFHSFGEVLGVK